MSPMGATGMVQDMRQNMTATAAVQLFMHTLQASSAELTAMAAQAMATNPTLEELPPIETRDTLPLDTEATRRHSAYMDLLTEQPSLAEHLREQVLQSGFPPRTRDTALALIPYLNRHGFFSEPPELIAKELEIPTKTLQQGIRAIRQLEPAGVGASDLRDSLILQLQRKGEQAGLPMRLLRLHWDDLVHHRYAEVARALDVEEEAIILAARHISRLNPDPGSGFSRAELGVVVPDLQVLDDRGELTVILTGENIPRLAISAEYRDMLAEKADNPELRSYLSRCFREGRELIRAIDERQKTILSIAQAIVQRQKAFFLEGPHKLSPMQMETIAADVGVNVSTISRAVRGKFLRCSFGVYELRRFFSAALAGKDGEQISADIVKRKIRVLVDNESPEHPLSDDAIRRELTRQGISIARRTIAKYREQLKILPRSLRRK